MTDMKSIINIVFLGKFVEDMGNEIEEESEPARIERRIYAEDPVPKAVASMILTQMRLYRADNKFLFLQSVLYDFPFQ